MKDTNIFLLNRVDGGTFSAYKTQKEAENAQEALRALSYDDKEEHYIVEVRMGVFIPYTPIT